MCSFCSLLPKRSFFIFFLHPCCMSFFSNNRQVQRFPFLPHIYTAFSSHSAFWYLINNLKMIFYDSSELSHFPSSTISVLLSSSSSFPLSFSFLFFRSSPSDSSESSSTTQKWLDLPMTLPPFPLRRRQCGGGEQ